MEPFREKLRQRLKQKRGREPMKSILQFGIVMALIFHSISANAMSATDWASASVKIVSSPCLLGAPRFEGSGLLFRFNERFYVVTSEHVLIHDLSPKNCISVQNRQIGSLPGKLIRADYYKGLALLSVNASSDIREFAAEWKELRPPSVPAAVLTALGYPSGSKELQILTRGNLLNDESHRALIPGVHRFVEASSLPVEFGMSGGVLLTGTRLDFAGILSHQYLKRDLGQTTSVGSISRQAGVREGDLAIAIPSSEVMDWLQESLSSEEFKAPEWTRDSDAQLKGLEMICNGVLCFSMTEKSASDLVGTGGGDGGGIGGASGGGDGGGIGGASGDDSDLPRAGEVLKVVSVELKSTAGTYERAKKYQDPTLEQLRQSLLRGQNVAAAFLRQTDVRRLVKFASLDQFFTLWLRDHLVPVFMKSRDGEVSSDRTDLINACHRVEKLAQKEKDATSDNEMKAWFSMIRDQALLAENGIVSAQDLVGLRSGANDVYWNRFYEEKFDDAVELEKAILALANLIKMKTSG
jgi:hypothetical protein